MKQFLINNKYLFKMFSFVRPYKFSYSIGAFLYCVQIFASSFILSLFLNQVLTAILDINSSALIYSGVFLIVAIIFFMIVVGAGIYIFTVTVAKATRDMKRRLFKAFINNSIEDSMSGHSGEAIAALNTEADTAIAIIDNLLFPLLSSILSIVFSSAVVFAIDYRIGLASVAAGGLAFFAQTRFAKPLGKLGRKKLDINASSVKTMSNIFAGGVLIRAFGIQDKVHEGFNEDNIKLKKIEFRRAFISMWQSLFTTIQGWLTLVIVFALGGWLVATGQLTFPMLIMAPMMCMTISEGISQIGTAWAGMQAPIVASERIFKILDNSGDSAEINRIGKAFTDKSYTIDIQKLSFKYKDAVENTLSDISLDIAENEMFAYV
jgi:ATP-binding cassette subfamily B protein